MAKKLVITISREFGSGGREVGERVAKELGIRCYDKAIIDLAAEKSGFSREYVSDVEQRNAGSLIYSVAMTGGAFPLSAIPVESSNADKVFIVQSNIIHELAQQSCVIVGRCADYILREREDCLHIFVHADRGFRVARAINTYGVEAARANAEVAKIDKFRRNHYQRYTDRRWGDAANFHASLDSGRLGIDLIVRIVVDMAREMMKEDATNG